MPAKKKTAESEPREAEAEETTTDEPVASAPTQTVSEPRPWRVETFTLNEAWGWRLCAANGVIIQESLAEFEDKAAAISAAEGDSATSGAVFLDRERGGRW